MLGRDSELRRLWWAVVGKDEALGARGPEIAAGMAGPGDQVLYRMFFGFAFVFLLHSCYRLFTEYAAFGHVKPATT